MSIELRPITKPIAQTTLSQYRAFKKPLLIMESKFNGPTTAFTYLIGRDVTYLSSLF